jgi:phage tail-like protein
VGSSDRNGHPTFAGPGFGTLVRRSLSSQVDGPPPVVSRRAILRRGLPSIYHESDFAMRFVGALEGVLDPIAAVLDTLPEQFSPDYASPQTIDMLSAWLGVDADEAQELDARRETVRMAAELGRRRGTVRGLELALRLSFPGVPVRVEDDGGVRWSMDGAPAKAEPPRFVVYVDVPIPEERQIAMARCIEHNKPVQATYRLRVKAPKTNTDSSGGGA